MDDHTLPADPQLAPICPWCSAELATDATTCASCGAILTSDEEQDLPGLTAVDLAVLRIERRPPQRSRLLKWISGEYPDDALTEGALEADAKALEPPDPAVQREILRLELEAEVANLQGEADSMRADAMVEGRVVDLPQAERPAADDAPPPAEDETPTGEAPA